VDTPSAGVKFCGLSTGINYNPGILNGGTPCTDTGCGSWDYIPGTRDAVFAPISATVNATKGPTANVPSTPYGHLRIVSPLTPAGAPTNVVIPAGTYTIGRYRFTNTVPWTANSDAQLWISPTNYYGVTNTIVCFYNVNTTHPIYAYTMIEPANATGLSLEYTQNSPMSRLLNSALATPQFEVNPLQVSPNPFNSSFQLHFETISNESVKVKVYDMLGKLVDDLNVDASDINTTEIGQNYQDGIYNVSVSQGDKTQHARVIKN